MQKRMVTGFGVVLLFIFGITIFFYLSFNTVIVNGISMEPTYHSGQRLLASHAYWLVGGLANKDVVVIKGDKPKEYIIKRIYKMEGEVVDFRNIPQSWSFASGEYHVPPGHIFVLGDNREASEDSRMFGAVPVDKVLGKIVSH